MKQISLIEDVQIHVMILYDKYNKTWYNYGFWCFPSITVERYDQQQLRSQASKAWGCTHLS